MIRNLKSLGLALVAVLALTAISASAASAAVELEAGNTSGNLEATQTTEQVFTTSAGTVRCTTSTQTGTYSTKVITDATMAPTYSGCKAFGFLSATVDVNGCKYTFNGGSGTSGNVSIVGCTNAAKDMTVTSTGCVVHVEESGNANLPGITYSNGASDVNVAVKVTNVKYTTTEGCVGGNIGVTQSNGLMEGGATLKSTSSTLKVIS